MLIFRWLAILCAIGIIVSFALYVGTGQERFKRMGLIALTMGLVFWRKRYLARTGG